MRYKIFIPIIALIILSFNALGDYYNTTGGNTIAYDGLYTVVTFTSNGTLVVNGTINGTLLIAAGGGGGGFRRAGGGGAGGFYYNSSFNFTNGTYTIIIGTGGTGGTAEGMNGKNGSNSSFGTIQMKGGGGGGAASGGNAYNGGSGGGSGNGNLKGTGISGQGFDGANGIGGGTAEPAGGGGGATTTGSEGVAAANVVGGAGGRGFNSSINGTNIEYACGAGGAAYGEAGTTSIAQGDGHNCGGDGADGTNQAGLWSTCSNATNGITYGSGGGGGGNTCSGSTGQNGKDGKQGVFIVRYLTYVAPVVTYSVSGNVTKSSVNFVNANVSLLSSQGVSVVNTTVSNSTGGYSFSGLSNVTYYLLLASYQNITSMLSSSSYIYVNGANQTKNLEFITSTTSNCVVNNGNWFFVPDGCVSSS